MGHFFKWGRLSFNVFVSRCVSETCECVCERGRGEEGEGKRERGEEMECGMGLMGCLAIYRKVGFSRSPAKEKLPCDKLVGLITT